MKRLVDEALLSWKTARRRKPLVVRGARQVGKTHSISAFGDEHFDELAKVDLERNPTWHRIFEPDLDPGRILAELRVVLNKRIQPGQTLLFLDEIQSCPRALMALRYLYEERPELHVVAAGSLLEFALAEISFPVGRAQFLDMHPLTFAEFLWAVGQDAAAQVVLGTPGPTPDSVHALLLRELRNYFFVGGMPESVAVHAPDRSFVESFEVQRELANSFRADFAKYAPRSDPRCLDAVLAGVARLVGQQVKYTRLAEGYSIPTIRRAFELLVKARVVTRIAAANPSGLPLGATASPKRFKAQLVDIGLLQHLRGMPMDLEYPKGDLLGIHEGALAEQFVGQEMMLTQGSQLYYWAREARGSSAEVDFLAAVDGAILPVEVKGCAAGRLRSLHMALERYPNCPHGLVFSSAPYSELTEQRLVFHPLYLTRAATKSTGRL